MNLKRVLASCAMLAIGAQIASAQIDNLPIAEGKFKPTDESLKQYEYPDWFRDAKFGIWAHWGPQAVPRQGDWYARNMYISEAFNRKTGEPLKNKKPAAQYSYNLEHYGHPSKFGFKDIIPLWKAERFDPEALMKLYKDVGAKYFVSMGVHHDNFFLWDSKLHPWNSVKMGPKRDIVGEFQKAAKKNGLKFGVSEHLGASYTWYQTAKGSDSKGKYKGVPYDGADPKYYDLYHKPLPEGEDPNQWYTSCPIFQREWYDRITELIDMYEPDLLYTDGALPFGDVGRSMIAHFYNKDLQNHKKMNAIYNCKEASEGRFVHDLERGIVEGIAPYPWQTDTSIGNWFYKTGQGYISSDALAQMLVDIVSKNGNLLINVVQTPEGDLEPDVLKIMEEFGAWMKINGDAIYATRPFSVYGEGPSMHGDQGKGHAEGIKDVRAYKSGDIRYTTKGETIYAFSMVHPEADITITSIPVKRDIKRVKMLGSKEKISFTRKSNGDLVIKKPTDMPTFDVVTFELK